MAGRTNQKARTGKLLDVWEPPEAAGIPLGCVSTTFTFDPVFFEEECLGRFLQMQSDVNEDGPVYLIEREEKLAGLRCAAVLVDAHHCKGDRSLRWDLLPARVPGAILHAKVTLLHWSNLVRLVVASANLTESGYRQNQEVFSYMDYFEGSDLPLEVLDNMIEFLREASSYAESREREASPALKRWRDFLQSVVDVTRGWGVEIQPPGRKGIRIHAVNIGPGKLTVFDQINDLWPGTTPRDYASVTTPFFDPSGKPNLPAQFLWSLLRQRGPAEVTYKITAEELNGDNALLLHAPHELLEAVPRGRAGVVGTYFTRIHEQMEESGFRPLHIKSLWLSNKYWVSHMIGSSNFTSPGYGISSSPNLEANIIYIVPVKKGSSAAKMLERSLPQGEDIDLDKGLEIQWQPRPEKGEDLPDDSVVTLPKAFDRAVYRLNNGGQIVEFRFSGATPPGWELRVLAKDEVFFNESMWNEMGRPEKVSLGWSRNRPPSGFEVTWEGCPGKAWWPVNVDRPASLPPPEDLKDLPLDALIDILTSARPLHQAMRYWLKHKGQKGDFSERFVDPHDPHKRVDTSVFLLQRTRRISWALSALREKLERPVASEDTLEWRLRGPIGVKAVAEAISKDACSDEEHAFLLTELALELTRVKPSTAPGYLPLEIVKRGIGAMFMELSEQAIRLSSQAPKNMRNYIQNALKEIKP